MEYGCYSIKEWIPRYLSGELTDEEKKIFENHILACEECRAELALFKEMNRVLDDIACEPPTELKERVLSVIKHNRRRKLLYCISKAVLPAAAMFAIVFLLCAWPRIAKKESADCNGGFDHKDYYYGTAMESSDSAPSFTEDYPDIRFFFNKEGFLLGSEEEVPEVDDSNPDMADKCTDTEVSGGEVSTGNGFLTTSIVAPPEASAPLEESISNSAELTDAMDDSPFNHDFFEIRLVRSYLMTRELPDGMGKPIAVYHYREYNIYIYECGCDFLPEGMTELYEMGEYSIIIVKSKG